MTSLMSSFIVLLLNHLAQIFGGSLGWAIVALSVSIRVALLPLTIRLSRRMMRNQARARELAPEIEALKARYKNSPERLFGEMQKLYKDKGYNPMDLPALAGTFVQLPLFAMLYGAIRQAVIAGGPFLWIRSLASPDDLLTLTILILTGFAAYFVPGTAGAAKPALVFIQVAVTCLIVWKLAAGLGLYWMSSSVVGIAQTYWIRRESIPVATV